MERGFGTAEEHIAAAVREQGIWRGTLRAPPARRLDLPGRRAPWSGSRMPPAR